MKEDKNDIIKSIDQRINDIEENLKINNDYISSLIIDVEKVFDVLNALHNAFHNFSH
jgi:hypothetical protein